MGFASETSSDSDADDESDSDTSGEPLAKRQYSAGIVTGVTAAAAFAQTSSSDDSNDERLSTSTNSSDGVGSGSVVTHSCREEARPLGFRLCRLHQAWLYLQESKSLDENSKSVA